MQGHPEAGKLWDKHIKKILSKCEFEFSPHEPCLYKGNISGNDIILLRQVDDFAIACDNEDTYTCFCDDLDKHLRKPLKRQGLITYFNGVDIDQTSTYIKVSVETYLTRVLKRHGWDNDKSCSKTPTPMTTDPKVIREIETSIGSMDPAEVKSLEIKMNFKYRVCIGEAIYALITCRPDISFPLVKLSQYSVQPAEVHYQAVKQLFKYLRATVQDGLYYWKPNIDNRLPHKSAPICRSLKSDILTKDTKYDEVKGYACSDSTWGADISHRHSVSGMLFFLCGAAIAWVTKFQKSITMSSTEAEYVSSSDFGINYAFV